MRLWSLHPKYLDAQGLTALWREALLAQAVIRGNTRGYRNHPQLDRFRVQPNPLSTIVAYLDAVHAEASARGYSFDVSKIAPAGDGKLVLLAVSDGQVQHEWRHLLAKLAVRAPALHEKWRAVVSPECHPVFRVSAGGVAPWERVQSG